MTEPGTDPAYLFICPIFIHNLPALVDAKALPRDRCLHDNHR